MTFRECWKWHVDRFAINSVGEAASSRFNRRYHRWCDCSHEIRIVALRLFHSVVFILPLRIILAAPFTRLRGLGRNLARWKLEIPFLKVGHRFLHPRVGARSVRSRQLNPRLFYLHRNHRVKLPSSGGSYLMQIPTERTESFLPFVQRARRDT